MARKQGNLIIRLLNTLAGNIDVQEEPDPLVDQAASSTLSSGERKSGFTEVVTETQADRKLTEAEIRRYAATVMDAMAQTTDDNEKIFDMVPDVSQAAEIVIASVISPNELKNAPLTFRLNSEKLGVDEEKIDQITTLLSDHFNKTLNLRYRLPEWLMDSLYRQGSKILVTLPQSVIDTLYGEETMADVSMETLDSATDRALKSCATFDVAALFSGEDLDPEIDQEMALSLESLEDTLENTLEGEALQKFHRRNGSVKTDGIVPAIIGSLEVVDRPDELKRKKLKADNRKARNRKVIKAVGNTPIVAVPMVEKATHGRPLLMEIPHESCIPLYVPGNPKEHMGYFVAIDHEGWPVEKKVMESRTSLNASLIDSSRQSPFDSLFRAYGLKELRTALGSGANRNAVARMYRTVMEAYIRTKLRGKGFGELAPGVMNGLQTYMFSKFLEGHKVRLLYLPKDYVTYMAFDYNADGTGKGKLEKIKFFLSLRVTLLIAQMMSGINNATDHKNINVQFGAETANAIGDPVSILRQIGAEYIKKNTVRFSLDPDHIMESMARRSIHVKATGMPGLQDFSVDTETGGRQHAEPPTDLMEDVRAQTIMGLDVPPATLNALGENEYSRSVASASLIFARKIEALQDKVLHHLTEFSQTYAAFDSVLRERIMTILETRTGEDGKEDGSAEETTFKYEDIVSAIELLLPKPNVAPNNSLFENFRAFFDGIVQAVESFYPDELAAGDDDITEALPYIRALVKKQLIETYMEVNGFSEELKISAIKDLATRNGGESLEFIQELKNLALGIKAAREMTQTEDGGSAY